MYLRVKKTSPETPPLVLFSCLISQNWVRCFCLSNLFKKNGITAIGLDQLWFTLWNWYAGPASSEAGSSLVPVRGTIGEGYNNCGLERERMSLGEATRVSCAFIPFPALTQFTGHVFWSVKLSGQGRQDCKHHPLRLSSFLWPYSTLIKQFSPD